MNSDQAYEWAWEHADRNQDGTVVEGSLVALVAERIDFDAAKERHGKAQRVVANRKRPGRTASAGAVVLPGMEPYRYEPLRLLADGAGNLVENRHATPEVKDAAASRSVRAAGKAMDRADRDGREADEFRWWATRQYEAGRDPAEVTWDTCVREAGMWKDADVDPDADAEAGEDL